MDNEANSKMSRLGDIFGGQIIASRPLSIQETPRPITLTTLQTPTIHQPTLPSITKEQNTPQPTTTTPKELHLLIKLIIIIRQVITINLNQIIIQIELELDNPTIHRKAITLRSKEIRSSYIRFMYKL